MIKKREILIRGSNNLPMLSDITYKSDNLPKKVIVFCHGFKGFKDWGAFDFIANKFAEADFVFLKFNFSHNGTTIKNPHKFTNLKAFGNNNFSKELNDLNLVLDYINSDKNLKNEIDVNCINLIGHSRGGGIAMIKSSEEDKTISKVVSWASPSDFLNKFPNERIKIWEESGVAYVYNSRTKQNMPLYFQFYQDCMKNRDKISITNACQKIKIPQLIVHGTEDETVDLNEAKAIHKNNPESKLHIIEGANHVFGMKHPFIQKKIPSHLRELILTTINFLES